MTIAVRIERLGKKSKSGTVKKHAVVWDDGMLILNEYESYEVLIEEALEPSSAAPMARLGERALTWSKTAQRFELTKDIVAHWVGTSELLVRMGERERVIPVRVEPSPKKAAQAAWMAMLRQLERWFAGVIVGHDGGRVGDVSARGVGAPLEVLIEALTPLLPALQQALRQIILHPHMHARGHIHEVPLRAATRPDRATMRWLGTHPDAGFWLRADTLSGPQPLVPQRLAMEHLDHPVNRYVCRLVKNILQRLGQVLDTLRNLTERYRKHKTLNDTRAWCEARAEHLAEHIEAIERLWRGSPLRGLPAQAAGEAATSVLIDHPAYTRLHQIGQRLLSPLFSLDASKELEALGAGVRSSFDLYELWTFSLVQRSLERRLPGWRRHAYDFEPLRQVEDTGQGAYVALRGPDDALIEVRFNHEFCTVPHKALLRWSEDRDHALPPYYSLSTRRRPDLLVQYRRGDQRAWVCLDAKYHDPDNLGGPLQKLHIYRDCLWSERYGGRCRAGLLLVPRCRDKAWTDPGFRERYRIGIWECPPGMEPSDELADWLLAQLGVEPARR